MKATNPIALVFVLSLVGVGNGTAGALTIQSPETSAEQQFHVRAVKVTTVADDIDAGAGGLAIDRNGNLYTADFGSHLGGVAGASRGGDRIYRVTPNGTVSLFCRQLNGASGNTFDSAGNLYQSNIRGNLISKIDPQGTVEVFSRTGFRGPVGIAVDETGQLFVCNCGGGSIQKVTATGESSIYCQSPLFQCPNGITRAADGTLYVCNFGNGDVIKVSPEGKASRLATLPGNNNGHLTLLNDYLYVVARSDHRIYQVGLDGTVYEFAGNGVRGKLDGLPGECSFSLPNSIAPSPDGDALYINETSPVTGNPGILGPTRIRRIEIRRTAGGPPPAVTPIDPPDPEWSAAMQSARQLIAQKKLEEAEAVLRQLTSGTDAKPASRYLLGYTLHGLKRYSEARDMYAQVKSVPQFKVNCLYNIACTYALENKSDQAIATLEAAVAAGFQDFDQLRADTDFESIRDDPRFTNLGR